MPVFIRQDRRFSGGNVCKTLTTYRIGAAARTMFSRGAAARALRQCNCIRSTRATGIKVSGRRHLATSTAPVPTSAAKAHPLAGVTSQIDHVAPRFEVDASQIEILDSPTAFYSTLKVIWTHQELGTC